MPATPSKKLRTRKDYPFQLEYRTRWSDNDMYGHLNNSIYAFLFDSIINTYLISHCDLDPTHENKSADTHNQIGLVVSSYCDYFASVGFPDLLDLGLKAVKLGSSSVTYEVGVFKRGEEAVKVVGGFTHVFVDRETMRPRSGSGMHDTIRKGLGKLFVADGSKL
ncbi:thioesterase family protein [Talaromyces proteolyticus]|uniref:Thioesterase family protein n=1 Tax=Talaromyces proteolyticus TaxID=1131652 RepID=A0AAD4KV95_9EURO|nr:thioesterase family protein [Talaromyces proteolyticus]KAH8696689.1 thioesterase family protein [Talaromyces proteolyticus]